MTIVALVLEDDPMTADVLRATCKSMAHAVIHAGNLRDALAAIAAGGYDYVLLDMQMPPEPGEEPLVGSGETCLRAIRNIDRRRNAADRHLLPVIIVTAYASDHRFVTKHILLGADGFLTKPFPARMDEVLSVIREALDARGGLADAPAPLKPQKKKSASPAPETPRPASAEKIKLVLDGFRDGRRTGFHVGDVRCTTPNSYFPVLLKLAVHHLDTPGRWRSQRDVGLTGDEDKRPYRIRADMERALPSGFVPFENDKSKQWRLSPAFDVEFVWPAMIDHPIGEVRKVAAERMARKITT